MEIRYPLSRRTSLVAWCAVVLVGVLFIGTLGWSTFSGVPQMFLAALAVEGNWPYFLSTVSLGGIATVLLFKPTPSRLVLSGLAVWATAIVFVYFSAMLTPFGH